MIYFKKKLFYTQNAEKQNAMPYFTGLYLLIEALIKRELTC